jgi:hypothetical protein
MAKIIQMPPPPGTRRCWMLRLADGRNLLLMDKEEALRLAREFGRYQAAIVEPYEWPPNHTVIHRYAEPGLAPRQALVEAYKLLFDAQPLTGQQLRRQLRRRFRVATSNADQP